MPISVISLLSPPPLFFGWIGAYIRADDIIRARNAVGDLSATCIFTGKEILFELVVYDEADV